MLGAIAKLAGGAIGGKVFDKAFDGLLGGSGGKIFDMAKGLFDKLPNAGILNQFNSLFQNFPPGILPFPTPQSFQGMFPGLQTPDKPFMPVSPCACQTVDSPGLSTNGSDTIDTGEFEISMKEDEVYIREKGTDKWVRVWGDPHVVTSDGDKAGFTKDNLTIDLPDGTKITFKPTPMQNGTSFIDAIAVMKGDEAIVVNGFHDGKDGVIVGNALKNAEAVDQMWEDGTVLSTGNEFDDLISAATGLEILGTDPSQRHGEHQLDGMGGRSVFGSAGANSTQGTDGAGGTDGTNDAGGSEGASGATNVEGVGNGLFSGGIFGLLMQIAQKLNEKLAERAEELKNKLDNPPDDSDTQANVQWEADMKQLQAEVQRLQNFIDQTFETANKLQKASHDSSMSIIRNFSN